MSANDEFRENIIVPPTTASVSSSKPVQEAAAVVKAKPKKGFFATLFGSRKKAPATSSAAPTAPTAAATSEVATETTATMPRHRKVEQEFLRDKMIIKYRDPVRRGLYIVAGIAIFLVIFAIGFFVIRALLPAPDADHDTVADAIDKCPGFDDRVDVDKDGIPDGCDAVVTPGTFDEISLGTPQVFTNPDGTADVAFELKNSNQQFGISQLRLVVMLLDSAGQTIDQRIVSTFANPDSRRTVIEPRFAAKNNAASATVTITEGNWGLPATGETISLHQGESQYLVVNQKGLYSKLVGSITNNSNFDLAEVTVTASIKDANGKVLSTNFTKIKTLTVGESRAFEIDWPETFAGTMAKYDLATSTNMMDAANLLKKRGSQVEF